MIPVLFPHLQLSDLISFFQIRKKIDREFENQLNKKFNSKFCITFSSGRAGLYNILKANNIQNKSVLVTAYTCCVVSEAISQSGNTPKFIDTKKPTRSQDLSFFIMHTKYIKAGTDIMLKNIGTNLAISGL